VRGVVLRSEAADGAVAFGAAIDQILLFHEGAIFGALLATLETSVGHRTGLHPRGLFSRVRDLTQVHLVPPKISSNCSI
jgi:hypothetical protein